MTNEVVIWILLAATAVLVIVAALIGLNSCCNDAQQSS
jgi:hypothetical protein